MNRVTPRMRDVARRLILVDTARSPHADLSGTFSIIDQLRPHLATLVGDGGVRALIGRALALAAEEVAWLRDLRVTADGGLEGLPAPGAQIDPADPLEGRVVLLAQLLGLLVAFIGPRLTSRLVGEIWPQLSPKDVDFVPE